MPPYNTRSAARKQALEPHENVVVSPSATGEGTHIRWIYPSSGEDPTLSQSNSLESDSYDRPMTPDEDEDEDEEEALRAVERMLAVLREQTMVIEERAAMADAAKTQKHCNKLQPESRTRGIREGPKLPLGVVGFGREGTWVVEDVWQPIIVPSTNQLPSVREFEEEQEAQASVPNIPQQDLQVGKNRVSRTLTPLPSFVTGSGVGQMK